LSRRFGRLDSMIDEWARDVLDSDYMSGFSGINAVEKILRDPGISTRGCGHVVLWWPRNKRIARISRAMHQVDPISQVCLMVDSGVMVREDGKQYSKHDLVRSSSLTLRRYYDFRESAKIKLAQILCV